MTYHFKDNGDFVCSCGSTIYRPRSGGETMWRCNSCGKVYVDVGPLRRQIITDLKAENAKLLAVMERLTSHYDGDTNGFCPHCGGAAPSPHTDHTDDCPYVAARAILDAGGDV